MMEDVILVDENDMEIGVMEKMEAHRVGALHRAVSVLVFNDSGMLLLQKRAAEKYHSPGKWSNTCCTHPRPGESPLDAAQRRLREEMGMSCKLTPSGHLLYRAEFDSGLVEHEFDHLFIGFTDALPVINPAEVDAYLYTDLQNLRQKIGRYPDQYTPWFPLCLDKIAFKTEQI